MSYLSLSNYQLALAALLPKRGIRETAEALAAKGNLPLVIVRSELRAMAGAGLVTFDAGTGRYGHPEDVHD